MAGGWLRGRLTLGDRKRLNVRARQLSAEARIDATTRWTTQAMLDSVYRGNRP
jgi:hypothetical protein